jgi:hypothetical protein
MPIVLATSLHKARMLQQNETGTVDLHHSGLGRDGHAPRVRSAVRWPKLKGKHLLSHAQQLQSN